MNSTEGHLVLEARHDAVAVLTLNRPDKANAYNASMLEALEKAFRCAIDDPAVRAIVITGAGDRNFCSGADIDEMKARPFTDALALESQHVFERIARAPKATVAAINGCALAGGLELALACDVRLASTSAWFGFPETELGIIPAAGGTLRLPRILGAGRAREMILFGRDLSAAEALSVGLVSEAVPGDELPSRALHWASLAADRDPLAIRLAKHSMDLAMSAPDATLRMEGVSQALLYYRRQAEAD